MAIWYKKCTPHGLSRLILSLRRQYCCRFCLVPAVSSQVLDLDSFWASSILQSMIHLSNDVIRKLGPQDSMSQWDNLLAKLWWVTPIGAFRASKLFKRPAYCCCCWCSNFDTASSEVWLLLLFLLSLLLSEEDGSDAAACATTTPWFSSYSARHCITSSSSAVKAAAFVVLPKLSFLLLFNNNSDDFLFLPMLLSCSSLVVPLEL